MQWGFVQGRFMHFGLGCVCSERCGCVGTASWLTSLITGTSDAADIDRNSMEDFKRMILLGIVDY